MRQWCEGGSGARGLTHSLTLVYLTIGNTTMASSNLLITTFPLPVSLSLSGSLSFALAVDDDDGGEALVVLAALKIATCSRPDNKLEDMYNMQ